jgi:hypothetical protein
MKIEAKEGTGPMGQITSYPLLRALRERRSRRFGRGMKIPAGPLSYESRFAPQRLSEAQEALMVYAACGVTGHALADLSYGRGEGGGIMGGLVARTIASGDGLQTVNLAVINDEASYLVRKPSELTPKTIREILELGAQEDYSEIYRRSRVKIKNGRAAPSTEPLFNINANRWSANAAGTTYFLPINDLTLMYINGLLEIFNETTGAFLLDERNHFQPAGLGRFGRSRKGHLNDNPAQGCVATIRQVEQFVTEFVTVEQGMMLQNLGLMAQGLGLGGFPNFANHDFAWFEALSFRMQKMPADRYLGAGWLASSAMKLLRKNPEVSLPLGLEIDGQVLLKPFCPPYYNSMADAVRAVVDLKFGPRGIFRGGEHGSAWAKHEQVTQAVPKVSDAAVEATIAYCEYLWKRYGRFPVYMPPYKTVLGFQACRLDTEFYDRFYRPEAVAQTQRDEFAASENGIKPR